MLIRQVRKEDFAGLAAVAFASATLAYQKFSDAECLREFNATHYSPERLGQLLSSAISGSLHFEVAVDEDRILGFACAGETPEVMQLHRLYVRPESIGEGVGKALLLNVERFARERLFSVYYCYVHKDNDLAKNFYLRAGFEHLEALDRDDDWRMRKRITSPLQGVVNRIRHVLGR